MQYAHQVKRVTVDGYCFGGAEIWTTSFYVGSVGADVSNPTQSFADAIRTAWTTFFTAGPTKIGTNWTTKEIKVAQIGTDGKTNLSNVVYAPYGTMPTGGSSSTHYPPQITACATLAVSGARGIASKGRMFLPGVIASLGADGKMGTTDAQNIANNLKAFFDAVNAAAPSGERVILASQGHRVKNSSGVYQPVPGTAVNAVVNTIKVGTVYDTQRRRRDNLVEQYMTSTLA